MAKKVGWAQSSRRRAQRLRQIADEWSPTTSRRVPIPLTSITRICVVVFDDPIDAAVAAPPNWTMGMGEGRVYRRDFSSSEVNAQDPDHSVAVTDLIPSSDPATGTAERVRVFNPYTFAIPADEPIVCVQDSYGDLYVTEYPTAPIAGGYHSSGSPTTYSGSTSYDIVWSTLHPSSHSQFTADAGSPKTKLMLTQPNGIYLTWFSIGFEATGIGAGIAAKATMRVEGELVGATVSHMLPLRNWGTASSDEIKTTLSHVGMIAPGLSTYLKVRIVAVDAGYTLINDEFASWYCLKVG